MNIQHVTLTLPVLWQFKEYPYLKVTKCKKIIDTKRGVLLKYGVRGFYINGSYLKRKAINQYLEQIPKHKGIANKSGDLFLNSVLIL